MPKVGRRNELSEIEYLCGPKEMTTRNAPFGTFDTPLVRARIIGGRAVYVNDDEYTPRSPREPSKSPVGSTSPVLPPIPQNIPSPGGYASALKDQSNSQRHSKEPAADANLGLNSHKLVPPISAPTKYDGQSDVGYGDDAGVIRKILKKYTARENYLPARSIVLEKNEELILRNKVYDELVSFDVKKLRDVYLELTGFDRNLSGYVTFQDLSFTLVKAKINITSDTLRLVGCLFVAELEPGKVNYEKVLSFLASSRQNSGKDPRRSPNVDRQPTHKSDHKSAKQEDLISSPDPATLQDDWEVTSIISDDGAASLSSPPTSPKYYRGAAGQAQENAKLLRMMQIQLADAGNSLDVESIYKSFREADREHRGTMSKEQIKELSYRCRVPLQESLVNQIIDKFKDINGQYQWEKYVMLLEKVLPTKTGLPIPESKRPLEYAKQFPQPSENWPKSPSKSGQQQSSGGHKGVNNNPPPIWADKGERQQGEDKLDPETVDPNYELPLSSPRAELLSRLQHKVERQNKVDRLERELEQLQREYESTKKQVEQEKKADDVMPWFDRFMRLANALYSNDASNAGYMTADDVRWLSNQYNDSYSLNIVDKNMEDCIKRCTHQNKVALDSYLKMLSKQGP